jgi:sarcosine oxidase
VFDFIVIGVGGVGSAAMYHLAARGARVLGLDRFAPGHDRGSSHGQTRIIRQAYFEHPDYVPLLFRAYELWNELGERICRPLIHEIGLLQAGAAHSAVLAGVRRSAREHGLAVDELTRADILGRYFGFHVPDGWTGVFERRAGYLDVEACVVAHAEQAQRFGAEIRAGVSVFRWKRDGKELVVSTTEGEFRARGLVVAAGPWASQLLAQMSVPLTVRRKFQYWYPAGPIYRADNSYPAFLFDAPEGIFYGLPDVGAAGGLGGREGMKVAEHTGGQSVADPLAVNRTFDAEDNARLERFLAGYLPSVRRQLLSYSACMYTLSPDEHFIVDRDPTDPRIVFAAGLSGHGFKFTCVLGEALADLAIRGATDLPVDFLSLRRFSSAG